MRKFFKERIILKGKVKLRASQLREAERQIGIDTRERKMWGVRESEKER